MSTHRWRLRGKMVDTVAETMFTRGMEATTKEIGQRVGSVDQNGRNYHTHCKGDECKWAPCQPVYLAKREASK